MHERTKDSGAEGTAGNEAARPEPDAAVTRRDRRGIGRGGRSQRIGAPLADAGHDVLALAADVSLEGLADPAILELAAAQQRVLVTRNSRDSAPLAREWPEAQRTHTGKILIWTLDHSQFAGMLNAVRALLDQRPPQDGWRDLVLAI